MNIHLFYAATIAGLFPERERRLSMALTDAEVAAVLRLKEQQERLLSEQADTIAAAQKAANELRDYIDPPSLRRMREQYDQIMAVADPPYLRELREADARMKEIIEPVHIKMI